MVCLSNPTAGLAGGGISMIIITSLILIVMCVIMKRRQTSKWSKLHQDGDSIAPQVHNGCLYPSKDVISYKYQNKKLLA